MRCFLFCLVMACMVGCKDAARVTYDSVDNYPVRQGSMSEMEYTPASTSFHLWSPDADEVRVMLYNEAEGGGSDTIWPYMSSLEYWGGRLFDGVRLQNRSPGHIQHDAAEGKAALLRDIQCFPVFADGPCKPEQSAADS